MNIDPSLEISHPDAEAALQALRDALHDSGEIGGGEEAESEEHERLVEVLRAAGEASTDGLLRHVDAGGLTGDVEEVGQGSRKRQRTKIGSSQSAQEEVLPATMHTLMTEFMDSNNGEQNDTSNTFVPREDYESLKARYEALLAQSTPSSTPKSAKRQKRTRRPILKAESSNTKIDGEKRKVRSLKLEHLIHQMTNRRLGVVYNVAPYTIRGTKELPQPSDIAPGPEESINGIQEYRPDFRKDVSSKVVEGFLEVVKEDVRGAWETAEPVDGQDLEEDSLNQGVETYWKSLCKRYDEQEINNRGGESKQQLGRRKQNQYRRQQSLLARRLAAFESSPLSSCRLRALYRGLLTISFAPRTEERPDPRRAYSQAQWTAYRKLSGDNAAYEIVDKFWLSDTARQALTLLDVCLEHWLIKPKTHGLPKRPSPTFHLPAALWDHSELPVLHPKTEDGLPDPERSGAIIFKWQVSETVQRDHPEWASGLYDDPPLPASDVELPTLGELLAAPPYRSLRRQVAAARREAQVPMLSAEDVEIINSLGVPEHLQRPAHEDGDELENDACVPEPPAGQISEMPDADGANADLEMVILASDSLPDQSIHIDPSLSLSNLGGDYGLDMDHKHFQMDYLAQDALPNNSEGSKPRGTSLHARRQRKKGAQHGLPDGAAMPVARPLEADGFAESEAETQREIQADLAFLQTL